MEVRRKTICDVYMGGGCFETDEEAGLNKGGSLQGWLVSRTTDDLVPNVSNGRPRMK